MAVDNPPIGTKMIDVRRVFHEKNPGLAKMLPGFIYNYLERIVHQDQINDFLESNKDKYGVDFARATIAYFNVSYELKGTENLSQGKRCIFASNHPLGSIDGVMMMDIMDKYYKGFRVLSNDILMNITNLTPLFLPVNKHGKQASEAAQLLHEAYLSDMQILTFPSGYVSRLIDKQVMDMEWKKNFITKAVKYQRDVVPVHCSGHSSNFFYRLANIRKKLGIKANIEMLYLVDEMFKHQDEKFTITFGTPISYTVFDKSRTPAQWAKYVKEKAYALGGVTRVPV